MSDLSIEELLVLPITPYLRYLKKANQRFMMVFKNRSILTDKIILLFSLSDQIFGVATRQLKGAPGGCCPGGLSRDLNPGPLAPEARIIPLDH